MMSIVTTYSFWLEYLRSEAHPSGSLWLPLGKQSMRTSSYCSSYLSIVMLSSSACFHMEVLSMMLRVPTHISCLKYPRFEALSCASFHQCKRKTCSSMYKEQPRRIHGEQSALRCDQGSLIMRLLGIIIVSRTRQ